MTEPVPRNRRATVADRDVRLLAFYLPQFHPVPENDDWWGEGFTEWTNVVTARPLFRGHYQPHLPADLGFYDLRLPETRAAQAELAAAHKIDGFVYYHYWFHGRRVLDRPFREVLESGEPKMPFALCWANENWTRAWDGGSRQVLIEQTYSPADDAQHIRELLPAFADERYIRVQGKPLFLVYRASRLPDPRRTTEQWRRDADRAGIGDLYLCKIDGFSEDVGTPPDSLGFDAAVAWIPDATRLGRPLRWARPWGLMRRLGVSPKVWGSNLIHQYERAVDCALERPEDAYRVHPCVVPGWDNSARRRGGGAHILVNATPGRYGAWLTESLRRESGRPIPRLVFVNAWNEWAEGNHLEPDQRWGRTYLQATRDAVDAARSEFAPPIDRSSTSLSIGGS